MITAIFEWFEQRNDPFPRWQPEKPPATLSAFVLHYTWPFRWLIVMASVISIAAAILDVYLFVFVGNLVDWLAAADRATFWADHSTKLIIIPGVVLLLVQLFDLDPFFSVAAVVSAAVPAAKTVFVLAAKYDHLKELAAETVSTGTLVSTLTLFVWLLMLSQFYPSVFPTH